MQIVFDCPKCLQIARVEIGSATTSAAGQELTSAPQTVRCTSCGWQKEAKATDFRGEAPARCLICGCDDLWRQKDFSQRLGVTIVVIGIAISTWFMMQMEPVWSLGTLLVFALADMVLYAVMRDRLVCYRCHAQYRHIGNLGDAGAFNLEVHERYRQQAIRLKQAEDEQQSRRGNGAV